MDRQTSPTPHIPSLTTTKPPMELKKEWITKQIINLIGLKRGTFLLHNQHIPSI